MLMAHARREFYHDEDEDGRIFKENRTREKGKPLFDPLKVNPHRVQLYSIAEIWHCVSRRLFELGIMHNPDEKSQDEAVDSESDDLRDDFDFAETVEARMDKLFRGKNLGHEPLASMMRPNDLRLL